MGWSITDTLKFIRRFRAVLPSPRRPRIASSAPMRWPASIVEDLRRLHDLPYEDIDPQSDWLARYIQEGTYGTSGEGSPDHR